MDFIPDLVTEPISRDPQHWGHLALSCLVTIDASAGEIRVPSLGHACRRGLDHNTVEFTVRQRLLRSIKSAMSKRTATYIVTD